MDVHPPANGIPGNYEEFLEIQVMEEMRPIFDEIRDFCNSLGGDVIEQVRSHRIVFCKSMNARWFADIKPRGSSFVRIRINRGRRDPIQTIHMGGNERMQALKDAIASAYNNIH